LFADPRELVGTRVIECINPEPIAEIRHVEDDRLLVQPEESATIHDILIRAGDESLFRASIAGEHRDRVPGQWQHAAQQAGFGRLGEGRTPIGHIDQRPAPQVSNAPYRLHVSLGHGRAGRRTGDFGGGRGSRDLLCLRASHHRKGEAYRTEEDPSSFEPGLT